MTDNFDDFIDRVKSKVDIDQVVEKCGFSLRKDGGGNFRATSPKSLVVCPRFGNYFHYGDQGSKGWTGDAEYQLWINGPYVPAEPTFEPENVEDEPPIFTLAGVRKDGYREYGFHEQAAKKEQLDSSRSPTVGLPAVV